MMSVVTCVAAAFFKRAFRGEPLQIDGDGRQERFFVYVGDLARAHVLALEPIAENRTFNLDGDEPVSIRRIAETVQELVGDVEVRFGPPRPGDLTARVVSTDRAREELGWIPRVSFRIPIMHPRRRKRPSPRGRRALVAARM